MMSHKFSPTIPLVQKAHALAQQFAQEQATPQQAKQVYFNTLAVYAVHTHLHRLEIETDLSQGDSWNSTLRAMFHSADLLLPEIGRLECCPILPGQTQMILPDGLEARIGCVAVQFNEQLDVVQLIGFVNTAEIPEKTTEWSIAKLQPFDAFIEYLPELEPLLNKTPIDLGGWLQRSFTAGWQTLESLLGTETIQFASDFRSVSTSEADEVTSHKEPIASACKILDFGTHSSAQAIGKEEMRLKPASLDTDMQGANQRLALLIHLTPHREAVDISVRICPINPQLYLPNDLQLVVWDEAGTLIQADARQENSWIELQFSGNPGEQFSLKATLGEISITEDFVI
jgi:hypothetical protein